MVNENPKEAIMEPATRTNRLAIISFVSGLILLISLGLYRIFFLLAYPTSAGNSAEPINRFFLTLMDLTVPVRNLSAAAAILLGIVALREIKKKSTMQKGKLLAWSGIVCGASWILIGVLVGAAFLLAKSNH